MSALLWIDTGAGRAIDLGNPFTLLSTFAEMGRAVGSRYDEFADLFGVPDATMDGDDADPAWLADVKTQAGAMAREFGAKLSENAKAVLEELGAGDAAESLRESFTGTDATGDPLARLLLEHGFTGTDRRGVKWVDGKEVKSDPAGKPGANAHTGGGDAEVESKAKSLAARIKEVPKALAKKVGNWVAAKHDQLAARYGKTGARAILGAMILLTPTPIPGSSLIPIALGEAVLRLRRAVRGGRAESMEAEELTAQEIERIARELLAEVLRVK